MSSESDPAGARCNETEPKRILIVEDDEGLNRLAQKSLKRAGFKVEGVLSGAKALQRIQEDPGMVVLLDQQLPDMADTDVVRTLQEQGAPLNFVAMTGHGDESVAVRMMKLGARDYLVKGFDLTEILPEVFRRVFRDLETEKRLAQAEAKLLESELQKTLILESISDIVAFYDSPELVIKWTNRSSAESVDRTQAEVVGRYCYELWAEGEAPCPGCPVLQTFQTRQPSRAEQTTPDGRIWSLTAYPAFDDSGRFRGVVEISQEITQQRQNELALLNAEIEKQTVLDNQPDHVILHDREHRIIWANAAAGKSAGIPAKDLIGRHCHEFWSTRNRVCDDCAVEMAFRFGAPQEVDKTTEDGRSWHVRACPIRNDQGEITHAVQVTEDITERKKAEEDLRKALARISFHVENSPLAVIEWEEGRRIKAWSSQAEAIFGWSASEVRGKSWADFPLIHPEDAKAVEREIGKLFDGTDVFNTCKNRNLRKDGSVVHCQWYNSPLRDESGRITTILSQVADVTELNNALEDLKQAKEQAEAANQAKSMFLANMSHEIRTPLNGVMGMHQLLQTTTLDLEQQEYVDTAIQSSKRLTSLLGDILDLSRIEAGRTEIVSKPFDFVETLRFVEQLFRPAAEQMGIGLSFHADPAIPSQLAGDSARLQQILNNLVGNAVKFTGAGSIEVEAHPLPDARPDVCRILFSVSDTGLGMDDDKMDAIFEPFTQVDGSYTRKYQGAGLGLAIVRQLVAIMGGNLAVASEPGKGTAFHFCLTFGCLEAFPAKSGTSQQALDQDLQGLKVLVAEDDRVNQLTLIKMLAKIGCRALAVEDGRQTVEALRREAFDLVLMDIQMPVMDGLEAAQAIRRGEAGDAAAKIPIIAVTAHAMAGDREAFLAAGVDEYVPKPVGVDALLHAISICMK